ncbi:hypothetical protein [Kitasatospora sp. LaBMicrA B282]|uniref:hypothetical protein n=1 Tax=Kitasatospora sp. LaBMicrA B282 TaxID=3420949 RepID=UPI003D0F1B8D
MADSGTPSELTTATDEADATLTEAVQAGQVAADQVSSPSEPDGTIINTHSSPQPDGVIINTH